MKSNSIFSRLNAQEIKETSNESNFYFEELNPVVLDKTSCKAVTVCVIREVFNKFSKRSELKLLIEATEGNKHYRLWRKLDGISAKRYKEAVDKGIDPSMVCFYDLHDPNEEYGKAENNYSWQVCRIRKDALCDKYGVSNSDEELFNKAKKSK